MSDPRPAVSDPIISGPRPEVLEFLATRRSRPAKMLGLPVPDRAALLPMLKRAVRVPDHGKLEPWRFIVLGRGALLRLAAAVPDYADDHDEAAIEKAQKQFSDAHLVVAVIEVQQSSPKIPAIEQTYSAGAVCLSLLNAALASGWGANWLTGWPSHQRNFSEAVLGLAPHERIAGLIHIGTEARTPPDRPRPDIEAITSWLDE